MAESPNWFKSAPLGGFRRQDVITYIDGLLKEHHEETESFRTSSEQLREERDEARAQAAELRQKLEELNASNKEMPQLKEQIVDFEERLNNMALDRSQLAERYSTLQHTYDDTRAELLRLQVTLSERETRLAELQTKMEEHAGSFSRAGDIEMHAYRRAESIENEAIDNAERSRQLVADMMSDIKTKYNVLRKEAEKAEAVAVAEVERLRQQIQSVAEVFAGLDEKVEGLYVPDKPIVRPFVPTAFDDLAHEKETPVAPDDTEKTIEEPIAADDKLKNIVSWRDALLTTEDLVREETVPEEVPVEVAPEVPEEPEEEPELYPLTDQRWRD